ncbi:cleavage stimulation factor subunit 1, putative [Plasmodium ovale wallikeri]|uniref:Cleavage stimulation factor 50 kDa subunit n=1 Tax=Plasmodium ovale wallikeri TaxID=864142 RepID=A0A1A8Z2X5_PLAOA|nr:cleavage stimulation factor subunit 1, putative [Plasmodium ovale wallikeri]
MKHFIVSNFLSPSNTGVEGGNASTGEPSGPDEAKGQSEENGQSEKNSQCGQNGHAAPNGHSDPNEPVVASGHTDPNEPVVASGHTDPNEPVVASGPNECEKTDGGREHAVWSIEKIAFYETVLKQLIDDNLTDSFNTLKGELNLRENGNVGENYLFNLYTNYMYKPVGKNNEEENLKQSTAYEALNKKTNIYSDSSVLNYDVKKEETRKIYSYEINDHIELIHKNKCTCCATNSTYNILCSGGSDNIIKIVKINDIKKRKVFTIDNKHTDQINCVTFHPTKNILFSASDDCSIKIMDVNKILKKKKQQNRYRYKYKYTQEKVNELCKNCAIKDKNPFVSMYVHPCGDFLYASNKNENIIKLYDLETLTCFTSFDVNTYHTSCINNISGTSDGNIYGSVAVDGHIKFWDGHNSQLIHTQYNAHNGYSIQSIQFSKSNLYTLTSGLDGQTKIWDIRNFKSLFTFGNGLSCSSNKSIFMNSESFIANIIQTNDHFTSKFYIYNSYFGNVEHSIQNIHNDMISDIVNAKDGLNVHTASHDGACKTIKIDQNYSREG